VDNKKNEILVSILLSGFAFVIIIDALLAHVFKIGTVQENNFLLFFIFYFFVSSVEFKNWKFKEVTQKLYIKVPTWIIIVYVIYIRIIAEYLI